MDINLTNFNVRRTNALILGNVGLPENVERYVVKGQGLIGLDIFKDDEITSTSPTDFRIFSTF